MEEKILNTRKNGMAMLLLTLLGYVVSIALFIFCITLLNADRPHRLFLGIPLLILSIAYWIAGIFLFCGLKVLKPQEALVLTLFGDYIGTLKGQGFYWVNPFCTAVNPAAGTRLSQSGDVNSKENTNLKDPQKRKTIAQKLNITQNKDGTLNLTNEKAKNHLLLYLLNKIAIDVDDEKQNLASNIPLERI